MFIDALNLNYFTQLQNQLDVNGNQTDCYLNAQKLLSYRDQVKSYRTLACKELRDHIETTRNNQNSLSTTRNGGLLAECTTANNNNNNNNPVSESIVSDQLNGDATNKPDDELKLPITNGTKQQHQSLSIIDDAQTGSAVDPERVERLLLRMSSLKKVNISIMEELFFNDVIGNVQIDSIIPSIIGSEITTPTATVAASAAANMDDENPHIATIKNNLTE